MSLRFLLDTNILSESIKKQPSPKILDKLQQHRQEIATASVVWHEMWFGCQRLPASQKRQSIEHFLTHVVQDTIPLLPYDAQSGKWHALERARLSQLGQTPPFVDGQIAAIAKINNLILVTRNVTDYIHFADLQVENWYES